MRRIIFLALGTLEMISAAVLFAFVWQLPEPGDVEEKVGRVERVSRQTAVQVRNLRDEVRQIRESQPHARQLAEGMRTQLKYLGESLSNEQIDYVTLRALHASFGDVAQGLDGMSDRLAPDGFVQLGLAMGLTADFLDRQVCPAADRAAERLDATIGTLRADAKGLADILRVMPNDLKAAREIHDSLAKFGEGLDGLSLLLKPQSIDAMREGMTGLESALDTGADQVALLAGYTYPVVTFHGLRPSIENRKFWPAGETVANGLRQASKGSIAARKEFDALAAEMPRLRGSVLECRRMADKTREALAVALKQQDKLETLLKSVPEHAIRLAEDLPRIGEELSRVLRETARMREVARVLRAGEQGLNKNVAAWPELKKSLGGSAGLLRGPQKQIQVVLDNRKIYEASMKQSRKMVEGLSAALPMYTDQWGRDMEDQERSLSNLGASIDEVSAVMPEVKLIGARLLIMTRLLLSLLGAIFLLHGGYMAIGSGRRV